MHNWPRWWASCATKFRECMRSVGKFCHAARGTTPPRSMPSCSNLMMPSLLRDRARNSSDTRTRRGSTVRGIAIPCLAPIILIHMHRALWMWAAIIRTVRRGTPGTAFDQIAGGRFSTRYIVTRLFVRQAAIKQRPVSGSVGTFVHSASELRPLTISCPDPPTRRRLRRAHSDFRSQRASAYPVRIAG